MRNANRLAGVIAACVVLLGVGWANAQDWPQWRGPNRDGKATGFKAPEKWPGELTKKWKYTVGDGVATPALVGDKLYVFSRQDGNEITRCINAASGEEIWQDKYEAGGATGPAAGFSGPRSSPTVVDGKVVTLGVRDTLSCLDATDGKVLWRKDDFKDFWPSFFVSSSPIVVDGLCIAQLGGKEKGKGKDGGGIVAYELATGNEKWKWTGDSAAYASPALVSVGSEKAIVAVTSKKIVGISVADGKLLWETPFAVTGRNYNAASPMIDGQTVIYTGGGRGATAVKLEKKDDAFAATELWSNKDNSVQYNTPVLKDGAIYALSDKDVLFCIDSRGKSTWSSDAIKKAQRPGYGSIVDAGSVLFALTPRADLVVFEPNDKSFKEITRYKVSDGDTYAYPVIAGNRVFVKDKDSVILWTIE
jgi:outer membrane protein assembly factor BamB